MALNGVRSLLEQLHIPAKRIACVGCTGQMGGIIGVDHDMEILTGYDSALDCRSLVYNDWILEHHGTAQFSISSGVPTHAAKMLWWKHTYPEVYKRVQALIPLSS